MSVSFPWGLTISFSWYSSMSSGGLHVTENYLNPCISCHRVLRFLSSQSTLSLELRLIVTSTRPKSGALRLMTPYYETFPTVATLTQNRYHLSLESNRLTSRLLYSFSLTLANSASSNLKEVTNNSRHRNFSCPVTQTRTARLL